jgi:ankyrin repeat protein
LIETHGADVNTQDNSNDTPVHLAFRYFNPHNGGDISVLHYFLNKQDLNVNLKGKYGFTLLYRACENINILPLEIFKLLIQTHGGDVNAQDEDKDTPIHHALRYFDPNKGGDINVLTYLINQQTVNINIKGYRGQNLLHLACINNLSGSKDSAELNAECDTILCQIVEFIVERCVEEVFDEKTPLEATTI